MSAAIASNEGNIRLRWALAATAMAVGPHLLHLPVWISLMVTAVIGWRISATFLQWPLPPRWLRLSLAIAVVIGVFLSYHTINGLDAGSALVVGMLGMKLLETSRARDMLVIVLISYFLLVVNFLYSQSIFALAYSVPAVWLITVALLQVSGSRSPLGVYRAVRYSGTVLLQALPLMLLLFMLFPRIPGPLWGLPARGEALSGLDDEMSPGTITRLSLSDDIAFTVRFEGALPPRDQLYWRGPVLHRFDGRTWRRGWRNYANESSYDYRGEPWRYQVTLEPHNRHWLFTLDVPGDLPRRTRLTYDFQLINRNPVTTLKRYSVSSYPQHRLDPAPGPHLLRYETHLPDDRNPRSIAFASALRQQSVGDTDLIQRTLSHFRQQAFVYTLEPLALDGPHPVDRFLFDTREGFCEHYASAFVTLMRAAGLPARVVTGYLGGERNPLTGHVTVRQSDAHAWAEVWLGNRGWQRIDPTAAVAPWRIRTNLASAMPASEPVAGRFMRRHAWLNSLRVGFDAFNGLWNEFILGYGPDAQTALLAKLGVRDADWRMLTVVLAITLSLTAALLAWIVLRQRPARAADPARRLYLRFCARLARSAGLARTPAESPENYARRCAVARPDLAVGVAGITESYLAARYGPVNRAAALLRLRSQLASFHP